MKELTLKFSKQTILILIGSIVLTIILFAPSKILQSCPKGLDYDTQPGQCGLYTDQNYDGVCDYVQGITTSEKEPVSTYEFNLSYALQGLIFAILFALSLFFLLKIRIPYMRYLILLISFVTLGIASFKNICPISTLQFLVLLKDAVVLRIFPFLIFLIPIIATLILGQVFCGWICPIGAFQEFIFRLVRISSKYFPNLTNKIPAIFNYLRYLVLIIVVILVLTTNQTIFCKIDPFGMLFGYKVTSLVKILFVIFLLPLPFLFRPFCKYICPYGALTGILSNLSIFKIKINKKKCTNCKQCFKVCLIGAIDTNLKIREPLCTRCGDCLMTCPKNTVNLQR